MTKPINVLLIEDNPDYARGVRERLIREPHQTFTVESAETLKAGLAQLSKGHIDVVLLDLLLPDSKGLETFTSVNAHAPELPIVILTALGDEALALEAVGKGAQDYLPKGETDGKTLFRVIRYAIERHRMQTALRSLSMLDDLTGLYNRRGFVRLAGQHLKLASRTKRGSLLVFADLDGLKSINDTFGHQEGDRALIDTADVLRGTFRTSDVIARIGGDEFAILAIEARQDSADALAARIQEKLRDHNAQKLRRYKLSLSLGVAALDPQRTSSLEELMAQADAALYTHKRQQSPTKTP